MHLCVTEMKWMVPVLLLPDSGFYSGFTYNRNVSYERKVLETTLLYSFVILSPSISVWQPLVGLLSSPLVTVLLHATPGSSFGLSPICRSLCVLDITCYKSHCLSTCQTWYMQVHGSAPSRCQGLGSQENNRL